ncbi:hypothetical protein PVAP13_8NG032700 [Panicum virgatum]|uniref:Reverse transcriptase zinc-binding domain-containing protein n=1 Tax=Panicum virgatum TaxID=38727 RepID=A0A8T0P6I3_PANVG|nr:hypothetical protein PVAP13_8NG032700 [Panicum virgatum]
MELDSVICDLCILQRLKTSTHLILRCSFAKACWDSIGVRFASKRPLLQIFEKIKRGLGVPFVLDIIILMAWSIWTMRNDWVFNYMDPSIQDCMRKFCKEFKLLLHRVNQSIGETMEALLDSVHSNPLE